MQPKNILMASVTALSTAFLFGSSYVVPPSSVWSWDKNDNDLSILREVNATTVYQELEADDYDISDLSEFEVYIVGGFADMNVFEAKRVVNKAAAISGCKGVVYDIEPYISRIKGWDGENHDASARINRRNILKEFVDSMRECNAYAKSKGLETIVCIPYWYDNADDDALSFLLEELVAEGCDGLSIMAYRQGAEYYCVEGELALAEKYNKSIETIFEMQDVRYHELEPINTYGDEGEGIPLAIQNYKDQFTGTKVGLSWHYMKPLSDLIARDGHLPGYDD